MIEISTPIQAQSSLENIQEKPPDVSVFGSNSQKKDRLGVFSKLLDGLIGKSKGKTTVSGGIDQALAADSQIDGNEETIAGTKSGKKLSRLGKTSLIPAENAAGDAVFPLFSDYAGKNPQFQAVFNPLDSEEVPELTKKMLRRGELSGNQVLSKEGFLAQSLTEDLGEDAWDALRILNGENEDSQFLSLTKGENRGKPVRGAVDLMSARNMETSLYQFSGEKRPGFVDQLAGFSANAVEPRDTLRNQEGRGRKTRDRINLEVRDFRTFSDNSTAETARTPVNAVLQAERIDAELKAEFRVNGGSPQERSGENAGARGGFEEALSRELKDHLSSDIVRQASIVLRNGGEGTIRLSLKPETLGNVKIRVEMTENKITGHIVVESTEAFKAFERELPVLEKQFQDSGFSEASLDMSFAGEGGNSGLESRENYGEFQEFSQILAASSYDAETERLLSTAPGALEAFGVSASGRSAVNMLV